MRHACVDAIRRIIGSRVAAESLAMKDEMLARFFAAAKLDDYLEA